MEDLSIENYGQQCQKLPRDQVKPRQSPHCHPYLSECHFEHVLMPFQCYSNSDMLTDASLTAGVVKDNHAVFLARHVVPMLGQCWASVVDGGPALAQHLVFAGTSPKKY